MPKCRCFASSWVVAVLCLPDCLAFTAAFLLIFYLKQTCPVFSLLFCASAHFFYTNIATVAPLVYARIASLLTSRRQPLLNASYPALTSCLKRHFSRGCDSARLVQSQIHLNSPFSYRHQQSSIFVFDRSSFLLQPRTSSKRKSTFLLLFFTFFSLYFLCTFAFTFFCFACAILTFGGLHCLFVPFLPPPLLLLCLFSLSLSLVSSFFLIVLFFFVRFF